MANPTVDRQTPRQLLSNLAGPPLIHRPRRILPGLVAAYILGLLAGLVFPLSPLILLGASTFLALIALASFRHNWSCPCLYAAILLIGWWVMAMKSAEYRQDDLRSILRKPREYAEIIGRIRSPPHPGDADSAGRSGCRFEFDVESIKAGSALQPATGRIRVSLSDISEEYPVPAYGDRWIIRGVFSGDNRPVNRAQGIAGYLNANGKHAERLDARRGNKLYALCYQMRDSAHERLGWGLASQSMAALPRALLLGYRQDIDRRVYDSFAKTGTLHILALSGMHVGILILLIVIFLKAIGITRPHWVLFFLPFLVLYTIGTGAAASTVRASIMALVYFSAYFFRRKPDTPSSLATAALLILLFDPLQLFSYGFILSFVVVGGIIAIYPVIRNWMQLKLEGDPWAEPEMSWLTSSMPVWRKLIDMMAISGAAWLASLPLIANIFHVISPIALLVNLALVPLAFCILLTACLSLVSGLFFKAAALVFNHANWLFSDWLVELVSWSSRLPGSHAYVAEWHWSWILGWYGLILIWLGGRVWMRNVALSAMVVMIVLSIHQRAFARSATVSVIPVGECNVLLIDGPGRYAAMIDAGSSYYSRTVLEQLRRRGISRLDTLWISRATSDSYGGVIALLESLEVDRLVVPDVPKSQQRFGAVVSAWENQIGADRIDYWPASHHFEAPGGLVFRLLYPRTDSVYLNSRQSAMICHISNDHRSVLFISQSDPVLETAAMQWPIDYHADTLVVGRSQRLDGLGEQWLERVGATSIVLSSRSFDRMPFGMESWLRRLKRFPDVEIKLNDIREGMVIGL